MSYIFLDESGDLGFDFSKKGTSKYFLITCLFIAKKRPIEKIVSRTFAELTKKHKKRGGVLHSTHEKPITRQRLLKRLIKKDCHIMTIFLDKKRVYTKIKNERIILYNFIANILLDRIYTSNLIDKNKKITLVAERKETSRFLNENFQNYIQDSVKKNHKAEIEVLIRTPFEEKALQAVDFASWAIFRKYEFGDTKFYKIIQEKIAEEKPLYS
jgi:hypothetical protein